MNRIRRAAIVTALAATALTLGAASASAATTTPASHASAVSQLTAFPLKPSGPVYLPPDPC